MKRYFIEEVKCDTFGGGPVAGIATSIKYKSDDECKWLTLVEYDFPNYLLTDDDVFDKVVENDFDEEFADYINAHYVSEINGIDLCEEYRDTLEEIENDPENPAANLVKYLIVLCRCPMSQVEELIQMATGKYADELEDLDDYLEDDNEWDEEESDEEDDNDDENEESDDSEDDEDDDEENFQEEIFDDIESPVISKRVMYNISEGVACGPVAIGSIDAEIIIIGDDEEKVYLHGEWVDAVSDEMAFEATKESIYDLHKIINHTEDMDEFQDLIEKRDKIREEQAITDDADYQEYYDELREIINKEIVKQGYGSCYDDEEWDEEWDEDDDEEVDVELRDDLTKEELYRIRLFLETDVNIDSVFHDMDAGIFKMEKAKLSAVLDRCDDEDDYQTWKNGYIVAEYNKVKGQKFLSCSYMFAGIGGYDMIIPEEEKDSFLAWIRGNGSAFFGGDREATEDEIKAYIALQAASGIKF